MNTDRNKCDKILISTDRDRKIDSDTNRCKESGNKEDYLPDIKKSTRSTKGKHSNLHKLPISSVKQQSVKLERLNEFGKAVAALGATLGNALEDGWLSYCKKGNLEL